MKTRAFWVSAALAAAALALLCVRGAAISSHDNTRGKGVRISWLGQACFVVQGLGSRRTVMFDPFTGLGYPEPSTRVDIALISHEHRDHNNEKAARGETFIIHGLTADGKNHLQVDQTVHGIRILGVSTRHDDAQGADRGLNTAFLVEMDGLRIVHLGDLGHALEPEQVAKLWPVDVLMIPVGGHFTIGPEAAQKVVEELEPRILIPMHYKTEFTNDLPIKPVDDFLKLVKNVKALKGSEYTIFPDGMPKEMQVVVFKPKAAKK